MTDKERLRRAIEFGHPDHPPVGGGFSPGTWKRYREAIVPFARRLGADIPADFDAMPEKFRQGALYRDAYGCLWECVVDGLEGIIKEHPFENWPAFETFRWPDPLRRREAGPFDLEAFAQTVARDTRTFTWAGGYDNRLWERLHFMRGFENTLCDLASGDARIIRLLDMILEHNLTFIRAVAQTSVDGVFFGDDWGDQQRLMINPDLWRAVFKPRYARLFAACRSKGKHVFFHTDGHLLPVIPDLIECGVSILNLQSRANGIDAIAALCKGKVCVAIDIDRQHVLPFGTPAAIRAHVRECVEKLDDHGGVVIWYNINPDVPLRNIEAFTEAVEEYTHTGNSGMVQRFTVKRFTVGEYPKEICNH